jgi:hypothetical protein
VLKVSPASTYSGRVTAESSYFSYNVNVRVIVTFLLGEEIIMVLNYSTCIDPLSTYTRLIVVSQKGVSL